MEACRLLKTGVAAWYSRFGFPVDVSAFAEGRASRKGVGEGTTMAVVRGEASNGPGIEPDQASLH